MCIYPMGVRVVANTEQKQATIVYTRPYAKTAGTRTATMANKSTYYNGLQCNASTTCVTQLKYTIKSAQSTARKASEVKPQHYLCFKSNRSQKADEQACYVCDDNKTNVKWAPDISANFSVTPALPVLQN